jgi:hypothetical protein
MMEGQWLNDAACAVNRIEPMSTTDKPTPETPEKSATESCTAAPAGNEFLQQAGESQPGLLREFWDFLRYNKAWWMTPIIVVLLLLGMLVGLAATGAAPFIYAIF